MVTPLNTPLLTPFHLIPYSLSIININVQSKKQTKPLSQQNPLLFETDLDSDDDPIFKRTKTTIVRL